MNRKLGGVPGFLPSISQRDDLMEPSDAASKLAPERPTSAPQSLVRVDADAELERTLLGLLPCIRKLLFRMLGPRADLDDATQDTLVALAAALPRLAHPAQLEPFARTIAVRTAYRYFSRRAPTSELHPERFPGHEVAPDEALAQRQALHKLHRCLEKLPAKRRAAFLLCAVEGLSPEDAAVLLGTSAGSVRSRFMHARRELSRLLSGEARRD